MSTKFDPPSNTRWHVPLWAWLPIGLAIIAESASNSLKAYSIGSELKRFAVTLFEVEISTTGAALVCAAIAVSILQARAIWAAFAPGTPGRQRLITGLAGALLFIVSTTALATHILEAQRAKASIESKDGDAYGRADQAYKDAKVEFDRLKDVRTTDEIEAAMNAAPVPRAVFKATNRCLDITLDTSMEACAPITALRIELASALRKRELEAELPTLKAAVDALPKPIEPSYWETLAASSWAWLLGLATVVLATFGPVICAKVERLPPANDNRAPAPTGSDRPGRKAPELQVIPNAQEKHEITRTTAGVTATRFEQVKAFVRDFEARTGRRPTFTEAKDGTGLPKATVSVCLSRLKAA